MVLKYIVPLNNVLKIRCISRNIYKRTIKLGNSSLFVMIYGEATLHQFLKLSGNIYVDLCQVDSFNNSQSDFAVFTFS